MHTINYQNAFIAVSEDCRAEFGTVPSRPGTIAALQYDLLSRLPYTLTSDDLLVAVTATRRGVPEDDLDALRAEIFARPQACLRTSPLVKTLGWGLHHDAQGRVALIARESADYGRLVADERLTRTRGMRSKRA